MEQTKIDSVQWRKDAIQRINKGTSQSMKLRSALYELWAVREEKFVDKVFDIYYHDKMNKIILQCLDDAVAILNKQP